MLHIVAESEHIEILHERCINYRRVVEIRKIFLQIIDNVTANTKCNSDANVFIMENRRKIIKKLGHKWNPNMCVQIEPLIKR